MGKIRRPTMGDRMDNAAAKRAMPKGSVAEAFGKQEAAQWNRDAKTMNRISQDGENYRGSREEAEHRARGRK